MEALIIIILFTTPILLGIAELIWADWLGPKFGRLTHAERSLLERFEYQTRRQPANYLEANELAERATQLAREGIFTPTVKPPADLHPDDHVWWRRQIYLTNPGAYHATRQAIEDQVKHYEQQCERYRTLSRGGGAAAFYFYSDGDHEFMRYFESRFPDTSRKIRYEVHADLKAREQRELERRKKARELRLGDGSVIRLKISDEEG